MEQSGQLEGFFIANIYRLLIHVSFDFINMMLSKSVKLQALIACMMFVKLTEIYKTGQQNALRISQVIHP